MKQQAKSCKGGMERGWRHRAPVLLLGAATLGLGLAQTMPRPAQPLALLFRPGVGQAAALSLLLASPGWDPIALRQIGPFTMALVAPTGAGAPPAAAWLVLPAFGRTPCAAISDQLPS